MFNFGYGPENPNGIIVPVLIGIAGVILAGSLCCMLIKCIKKHCGRYCEDVDPEVAANERHAVNTSSSSWCGRFFSRTTNNATNTVDSDAYYEVEDEAGAGPKAIALSVRN